MAAGDADAEGDSLAELEPAVELAPEVEDAPTVVAPAEPDAEAGAFALASALALNASNVFWGDGFTAKTIPCAQWLIKIQSTHQHQLMQKWREEVYALCLTAVEPERGAGVDDVEAELGDGRRVRGYELEAGVKACVADVRARARERALRECVVLCHANNRTDADQNQEFVRTIISDGVM